MGGHKILNCITCGEDKPHCAKGLCYDCYSKQDYHKHKEKRQMTHNIWVENNREKVREYNRVSYNKHKQKESIRKSNYYLENKENIQSRNKKWRDTPKAIELNRLKSNKRRANIRKVIHSFTYDEWVLKLRESQGVCQMCKEYVGVENLTLDHIFPISKAKKGFIYTIRDVQPLCKTCNCHKSTKTMEEIKMMEATLKVAP